jgi:hypothetical protein
MTFLDYIDKPQSKKISIVEIDVPISDYLWINYQSGIFYTMLTPTSNTFLDDYGVAQYWNGQNDEYYNIQSLNIDGTLYSEVANIATCISTEKSWFYDTDTTEFYIHFEGHNPPWFYGRIALGAAIGFTNQIDTTCNNYFEDIYYEPLIESIPNLSKKKDPLFFGVIQYQGGSISFNNTSGYFDDFATRDLYGQPIRIKLSFEGLDFDEQLLVYSGRVEGFSHDFNTFKLTVADLRKLLSRKLPINTLSLTAYPDMDSKLDGTPIPIAFGDVINGEAYLVTDTTPNTYVFCDTTYNAVDTGIAVVDKDGATVSVTQTAGTFTATSTEKKLYVTFSVSAVENGLDIISDILENYENIDYNAFNYDIDEWTIEKASAKNSGIWIGKGNLKTSADIIEQICIDNNGIFDVLADGRYTFRTFNAGRTPEYEISEDELLQDPTITYNPDEYLSSAKVEYSRDLLEKDPELYTNDSYETEVFGRYRQYKERTFKSTLTNASDAASLTESILDQSKFIYPRLGLLTKTQNIGVKILGNILYSYSRQDGSVVVPRSKYQVLGVNLNMSDYTVKMDIKQIEEETDIFMILDGGDSETDYDFYDGGSSTTTPTLILDGGGA